MAAMRAGDSNPDELYSVASYTDPATAAFVVIPLMLLALLMWGTYVAWTRSQRSPAEAKRAALVVGAAIAAWMALTWIVAASGVLRDWNAVPPRIGMLVLGIVAISCGITFSPLGRALAHHLPLWVLVAVQFFRFPLEIAMHTMYERGVMPEQMTFSGPTGSNFDNLTGITAVTVAMALARGSWGGRAATWLWNIFGLALLLNVVTIAIVSTPTFAWFGHDREQLNVWVTYPPYVWLPAVMVTAALTGHLLIFRALLKSRR
jgi:hypothetical protein